MIKWTRPIEEQSDDDTDIDNTDQANDDDGDDRALQKTSPKAIK